jgi:mannose-6-phosphate isomerase-like protein (cupin superfamily)
MQPFDTTQTAKLEFNQRYSEGTVTKGWGAEEIWVTNDHYCSKFMHFNAGASFSMHFHRDKVETWLVMSGTFKLVKLDTSNASEVELILLPGMIVHNDPLEPHQLFAITQGTILEVSTPDSVEDNYRVRPGDSQK